MSIDKFGRTLHTTRIRAARGPPGVGYKLTADGDYDIENKRLKNINYPIDELDACNKKYVDELQTNAIVLDSDKNFFNARNLRISNVAEPANDHDVCTKNYLDNSFELYREKILNTALHLDDKGEIFDAGMRRVGQLALPISDNDAAHKFYVDETVKNLNGKVVEIENRIRLMIDVKFNAYDVSNKTFVNNTIVEVMKQIRLCEEKLTKLQTEINTLRADAESRNILLNKENADVIRPTIDNFDSDITDRSVATHLQ